MGRATFVAGDCASAASLAAALGERSGGFDVVLAQLLLSVIGGPAERTALLAALRSQLRPGGKLLLSASGVSDDINPSYAETYRTGLEETGEQVRPPPPPPPLLSACSSSHWCSACPQPSAGHCSALLHLARRGRRCAVHNAPLQLCGAVVAGGGGGLRAGLHDQRARGQLAQTVRTRARHDHLAAAVVDFSSLVWLHVACRDQAAWFLYLVATHDGSAAEGGDGGA